MTQQVKETMCTGCGKPIVWADTADGKHLPLDPRPPVYRIVNGQAIRVPDVLVLHFSTCSQANKFSGSNRKPAPVRKDLYS